MNKRILAYAVIILSVVYFYSSEAEANDVVALCEVKIGKNPIVPDTYLNTTIAITTDNPNKAHRFYIPENDPAYCELSYWGKDSGTRLLCALDASAHDGFMSDLAMYENKSSIKLNAMEVVYGQMTFSIWTKCTAK